MRGTRWGRRQHWLLVLLTAATTGAAAVTMLGRLGVLAAVLIMAIAW